MKEQLNEKDKVVEELKSEIEKMCQEARSRKNFIELSDHSVSASTFSLNPQNTSN